MKVIDEDEVVQQSENVVESKASPSDLDENSKT